MVNQQTELKSLRKTPLQRFIINFKKNWQLHLMMLLPLTYLLVFCYGPMYGVQIAFREFRPRTGIWDSAWVGLKHFEKFFQNYRWTLYAKNTLTISLYSIAAGFPVPIILALILHINENERLKKITQNVSYLPHFISVVVMVTILNQILSPVSGVYGVIMRAIGYDVVPSLRGDPDAFFHLFTWSGVWQNMGWSAIMYVAALAAVPLELHEAAKIDGASRLKRVIHVDLPTIVPTICLMLILRFGSIMDVGHDKAYLMQTATNIEKSEIISTYVYKNGVAKTQYSFGTAVGLLNSVINIMMVSLVNWITNKLSDGENGLF